MQIPNAPMKSQILSTREVAFDWERLATLHAEKGVGYSLISNARGMLRFYKAVEQGNSSSLRDRRISDICLHASKALDIANENSARVSVIQGAAPM